MLPILHLNGYKISGPTVLGRASDDDVRALLTGHGYDVAFVEGDEPGKVHRQLAATLDECYAKIRAIQAAARQRGATGRPRWPAIVLRTPKGWTGPKVVDGVQIEGTFRAHQVPLSEVRQKPDHLRMLEAWMRSYRPEELFDAVGRLVPEVAALAPVGERRMGANPHANGGRAAAPLDAAGLPRRTPSTVKQPARERHESTRQLGKLMTDIFETNVSAANFRLFCPDETNSNRLGDVFEVENRCFMEPSVAGDDHVSPRGRVMEVLSEHNCQGWLEGYALTGRHGLFATYEAFAMVSASMVVQHAKWLEESIRLPWRKPIPSLNVLLTSTCWRNDHNGFSHQGPGLIDVVLSQEGDGLAHLSAARRQLPAVGGRSLLAQPELREPHRDRQAAAAAVARHRSGHRPLRRGARRSGPGPATMRAASRTWSWRRPATSRRWRPWPRRGGSAATRRS